MEEKKAGTSVDIYGKIEKTDLSCRGCDTQGECSTDSAEISDLVHSRMRRKLGYTKSTLEQAPQGAELGLGCGNPIAMANLQPGETVLELGSKMGLDCFLAALSVGKTGKVMGAEPSGELTEKARANAVKGGYANVSFMQASFTALPLESGTIDVIIANCAINLAADKARVFAEAFRVLKPGGRIMCADIVLLKELPADIKVSLNAYVGCLSGAAMKEEYLASAIQAGFTDAAIIAESRFPMDHMSCDSTANAIMGNIGLRKENLRAVTDTVVSIKLLGHKPH